MNIAPYAIPGLKFRGDYKPSTTKDYILEEICHRYKVNMKQLKSPCRDRDLTFVRHLAMYLLKNKCHMTVSSIGREFDRDHSTVLHAIRVIGNYMDTDEQRKKEVEYFN